MKYRDRLVAALNMMSVLIDQCNYDHADAACSASNKFAVAGEDLRAEYAAAVCVSTNEARMPVAHNTTEL